MQRFDPPICGQEAAIREATHQAGSLWLEHSNLNWSQLQSGFACALHMHQPTVPAGPDGAFISGLAQDGYVGREQLLGDLVEVVGVKMGDDDQIGAGDRLLRLAGQIDEGIG